MRRALFVTALLLTACAESHERAGSISDAGSDTSQDLDAPGSDAHRSAPDAHHEPWSPPFAMEPTSTPFCVPTHDIPRSVDAWADARGLFLLVDDAERGATLSQYDGARWISWMFAAHASGAPGVSHLTGVADGPLFVWPLDCPLARIDAPGELSCFAVPTASSDLLVTGVELARIDRGWVLGSVGDVTHAYQIWTPTTSGGEWTMGAPIGVWGDAVGVFALSADALFATGPSGSGRRRDIPAGPYAALWGVDRNEVGVATTDGRLLVLSSSGWATHAPGLGPITFVVRTATDLSFAGPRYVATGLASSDVLASWTSAPMVAALAGANELTYVAIVDETLGSEGCGNVLVARHDAVGWHRL